MLQNYLNTLSVDQLAALGYAAIGVLVIAVLLLVIVATSRQERKQ